MVGWFINHIMWKAFSYIKNISHLIRKYSVIVAEEYSDLTNGEISFCAHC